MNKIAKRFPLSILSASLLAFAIFLSLSRSELSPLKNDKLNAWRRQRIRQLQFAALCGSFFYQGKVLSLGNLVSLDRKSAVPPGKIIDAKGVA